MIGRVSLTGLAALQAAMFAALATQTAPHPPLTIALGGVGPLLGAGVALALAAREAGSSRLGRILAVAAALVALVSMGPHKWVDAKIGLIWPMVALGQLAAAGALWRGLGRPDPAR